jgi:hypothetical protein
MSCTSAQAMGLRHMTVKPLLNHFTRRNRAPFRFASPDGSCGQRWFAVNEGDFEMKKIAMLICAAALTVCGSLNAQVPVDTVNVRFASPVIVGAKTLPAGDCTIHIARGTNSAVLSMRAESGETTTILVNRMYDDSSANGDNTDIILERRADGLHFERILLPDHRAFSVLPSAE